MKPQPWSLLPLLLAALPAQQLAGEQIDRKLWTRPERTGWKETSTSADVASFLNRLHKAYPGAFTLDSIGTSLRGRPIRLAVVQRPRAEGASPLRAVIIANIHGGEVEGKEAVQVLLREIALGRHRDVLAACDLWFVPIYNVDGNDQIRDDNRLGQNGPDAVGARRNSQGLDLNRDVVKAETPETRALLRLLQEVDPHLFMDLHTTNGSPHGYHLTYAPSLTTNMDRGLADFMHGTFLPKLVSAVKEKHSYRVFDYGNFGRGEPSSWTTYAHTPRYAINYYGLRNRLSLLSEAYSYLPFRERAQVTRAFVLESLRQLVAHGGEVRKLCEKADTAAASGKLALGYKTDFGPATRRPILVGSVARDGRRRVAGKDFRPVEMDVRIRFRSAAQVAFPHAWAIPGASAEVRKALLIHGVEVHALQAPVEVRAESFRVESAQRPRFRYEGHSLVTLRGAMTAGRQTLPAGTLIVRAQQRTSRIAAQLLEAQSEDSLATWNFFDAQLAEENAIYPVLRVLEPPTWKLTPVAMRPGEADVRSAYRAVDKIPNEAIVVGILCTATGRRLGNPDFRSNTRWQGREMVYRIGPQKLTALADAKTAVQDLLANPSTAGLPFVLQPGNTVTNAEILAFAQLLNDAGVKTVLLKREPE